MSDATTSRGLTADLRAGAGSLLAYLKPLLALLVVWELVATLGLVPQQALPHTYAVADAGWALTRSGVLIDRALLTAFRAVVAFCLAIAVGVTLGLLMAQVRAVEWFFDPLVSVGFPVPKVTLVPIYVLWFGFGTVPAVLLAVTSAVFPVVIATHSGAKGVERELVWSARSMGVSRLGIMRKVVLPAALPEIFNGVQISLFLSFVVTVVAEMVTSAGGIGQLLTESVRFFRTPDAIAALLVIAVLGLVFDRLFRFVRGRLLRWVDTE